MGPIKFEGICCENDENKRRLEVNQRDNCRQQPSFKRPNVGGQNVTRAYTAGNNERKPYNGPLPLYNKCKLHHEGPCTMRCRKCNKCGRQGHYKSDFPKLKDQNCRNKAGKKNGVGEVRGKAYVLGGGDTNPDSNVVKVTFLLNNHYASMIFDSGADRSFVSTNLCTLLDVTLDTLDVSYDVKLADRRISETNTNRKSKERDQFKKHLRGVSNYSKSLNDLLESQVINKFKTRLRYNAATAASPAVEIFVNLSDKSRSDKGYHSVPPPYTGNFMPRKPDLTFIDEIVESENMDVTTVITPSDFKKDMSNHKSTGVKNNGDAVESKTVRENNFIPPIIEDWNSNDESKVEPNDKTYGTTAGTNVNKMTHPHPKRSFVPQAVLTRTGKINIAGINVNTVGASINTVIRPINNAASTLIVNHPRPKSNAFKRGYS
ncbi:putative reverse transcriptase domain-containing protein [Tanacetum coccineum]|uniref:Reverse transcriptase domain-containing protein n=1 Tax=Tanacetum coccineum TaxID=301880 RepID=A0ABQ4XA93_9ASTR